MLSQAEAPATLCDGDLSSSEDQDPTKEGCECYFCHVTCCEDGKDSTGQKCLWLAVWCMSNV
jgi:hypothetical protein